MMYVPEWCAHGFCVLSDRAEILYHASAEYAPDYEAGVMWNDPALGIDWPVKTPILSERDTRWPPLVLPRAATSRGSGDR
jgi:dTDP-4-dehydrorhamnose 3,5-epimerase